MFCKDTVNTMYILGQKIYLVLFQDVINIYIDKYEVVKIT